MKLLYLDLNMGAAGDMLSAALYDLMTDVQKQEFLDTLNAMGLPDVTVSMEETSTYGIRGKHSHVVIGGDEEGDEEPSGESDAHHHDHDHAHGHGHGHEHTSLADITGRIAAFALPEKVKADAAAIYELLAGAESKVHGTSVSEIHFHEVGTKDAIMDITAVCLAIHILKPDRICASPVHVGSGTVRCAHGVLPVPAPAAAELLAGIPVYGGQIRGELCTPTGAALLKYFVHDFSALPAMTVAAAGYGIGKKDFGTPNCVRAMLGETFMTGGAEGKTGPAEVSGDTVRNGSAACPEEMLELRFNVDDMTGEEIGFACEELLAAGAADVFTTAVGMKKSRPGIMFTVLCREELREEIVRLIFRHTTTIGLRVFPIRRYIQDRSLEEKETSFGTVRLKRSTGFGAETVKYEYEDLARIARENGLSLQEVRDLLQEEKRLRNT